MPEFAGEVCVDTLCQPGLTWFLDWVHVFLSGAVNNLVRSARAADNLE